MLISIRMFLFGGTRLSRPVRREDRLNRQLVQSVISKEHILSVVLVCQSFLFTLNGFSREALELVHSLHRLLFCETFWCGKRRRRRRRWELNYQMLSGEKFDRNEGNNCESVAGDVFF